MSVNDRHQRGRPGMKDAERIFHHEQRRFGLPFERGDRLVDRGARRDRRRR